MDYAPRVKGQAKGAGNTARGAVPIECLVEDEGGDLVYTCTRPWSDGTTGITLSLWEVLWQGGGPRCALPERL
jgi:hypothetical protein